ncbi:MAG: aminopeptidase, partial [Bacteroidetes bacterium]|nr:aminopeptidase [Bacteroidota bacterium]
MSFSQENTKEPKIDFGVSKELAEFRSSIINEIQYQLKFDIPELKTQEIKANELLSFYLFRDGFPLQLDFKAQENQIQKIEVNGKSVAIHYQKEHIIIPASALIKGKNQIQIAFIAGNSALNRNNDYLYTLFVPDRARTVFPCFDQPDLKAIYQLSLEVPEKWEAISNGTLEGSFSNQGRK